MKTFKTGALALVCAVMAACGQQLVEFDDSPTEAPNGAPTVISTVPARAAPAVSFELPVSATFSEAMDPATITTASFQLFNGITQVPGSVSYAGETAVLTPASPLAAGTLFRATITAAATDLGGLAMEADYTWAFTTAAGADTTPPQVSSTVPATDATGVAANATIGATFSEAMDPATLSGTTFTLRDGAAPVAGTVSYSGITALFSPAGSLAADTVYTATVTAEATDLAGNALAADHVWSFTTGSGADTTRPLVSSTTPLAGAVGVAFNATVSATFSEPMNPATVDGASFTLLDGATPVPGAVAYAGVTATFTPTALLAAGTVYTATITPAATDLAGNALGAAHVWSFTTGGDADTTPPAVIATVPLDLAAGVALDSALTATFSEAMNPLTLTTASFTLADGLVPVAGAVSYAGVTGRFVPGAPLFPDTLYTATVTAAATDLAGNQLAADFVWTFTTGAALDTTPPQVIATLPLDLATNVALNSAVSATFSEAMDPLTISAGSFTLFDGATPVLGAVTYLGVTATLSPAAPLVADTLYTATVTVAATDLAGNALVADHVWSFTTAAAIDVVPPTVILESPLDLAIDVSLSSSAEATFSEPMDALTITGATFFLEDPAALPVAGVVSYDVLAAMATFTPAVDLLPSTTYTATITTGAADLAGNSLAADFVWSFTTVAPLDLLPPTVILTNPLDLDTYVSISTTVDATFSEAMDPLSIWALTFLLEDPAAQPVAGLVSYDALGAMGTFTPTLDLLPLTTYTATVTTGATDLAGNGLVTDHVWSFTTGGIPNGMAPVDLRSLASFVAVAGAGLTNSNSGGTTTLNGDVGLSPTGTCLGDGIPCTALNPVINGTLFANDPGGVAAQAKIDLTAAYVDAMSRPPGTIVNDISGMVLTPGVYTSASTMSIAVGQTVMLDGQGDANAVFIFQVGSSLTVNDSAQVLLSNGATAANVFWAVFASSTLGADVALQGNVLAGASNSVGTRSTVVGRLLCTTGQITLLSNTITLP